MPDAASIALVFLVSVAFGAALAGPLSRRVHRRAYPNPPTGGSSAVAIGTVRTVAPITVDVESVSGHRFVGRLRRDGGGPAVSELQPGVVLLVAFDPATREQLTLADDIAAVRSAFDQMLVRKGLVTAEQLELIRFGIKASGVVTAMKPTGDAREDYREVELDLMVRRPEGGQFPAHETALVPASSLTEVAPGSVVDTYYWRDDESAVAVCVPPS